MPVPPEVEEKIRQMRLRLKETERLAGIRPPGRPPNEPPADPTTQGTGCPESQTPEPAQDLTALATTPARTNQVFQWILSGATEYDITEAIAQAWPEANQAELLLAAIARIRDSNRIERTAVHGFCFEATRDLYRRMVEIGDFPGALRAIQQLRNLTH